MAPKMPNVKKNIVLSWVLISAMVVAPQSVMAEIHIQCAKTRNRIPAHDYHKDDATLSVTVTSSLTTDVTVETMLPAHIAATIPAGTPGLTQSETDRLQDIVRLRTLIQSLANQPERVSERLEAERILAEYQLRKPEPVLGFCTAPGMGPKLMASGRHDVVPPVPNPRKSDARTRLIDCRIAAAEHGTNAANTYCQTGSVPTEFIPARVKSRTFRIGTAIRLPNGVIFDDAVLTVYETGVASVNGLLLHDGGPNQALLGSEVTVRVRALGDSRRVEVARADGPLFWEVSKKLRISRGKTERLMLTSEPSEEIRLHFSEIHRMEVNLESPVSR